MTDSSFKYRPRVTLLALEWPNDGHSGGVARYAFRMVQDLRKHVELTIVTFDGGVVVPGVTMVFLPKPRGRFSRYYGSPLRLMRAARSTRPDLVHSFGDDWGLRVPGIPLVRTFFGSSWSEAKSSSGLRRINHVFLAGSEWLTARRADTRLAIAHESVEMFDCQFLFPPMPNVPNLPDLGTSSGNSIVFIGSYGSRKRGRMALEAVDSLRESGAMAELIVFGPESDFPNWPSHVVHRSGASDEEVLRSVREAKLLVSPSSYEGFGIPIVEALGVGTRVVATENAGSRYLDSIVKCPSALKVVTDRDFLHAVQVAFETAREVSVEDEIAVKEAIEYLSRMGSASRLFEEVYVPLLNKRL